MKRTHEIKIWPQYYFRVANGSKTFEIRENDRDYQSGDKVILREWDPKPINPTDDVPIGFTENPPLEFSIGYVHALDRNKVVFSLLPLPPPKAEPEPKVTKTSKLKNA